MPPAAHDRTTPDPLRRARSLAGTADAAALYADWAERYDHDVFEVAGVIGTERIADLLAEHLPDRSAPVIDLGCGTGAAGARLRRLGFFHVDGVDLSPEMLEVARRRGAYDRLEVGDLTGPLATATPGGYGASIAAGVFTTGHVGAAAMPHLVRLVRSGGVLAWVVADPLWAEAEAVLSSLDVVVEVALHEPVRRGAPPEARFVIARRT